MLVISQIIFFDSRNAFRDTVRKHDSRTQAKYPGSKGLLIDPIYFDPAKMEKFVWIVWCCQTR